jgi:hypothetical protein
MKAVIAGLSLLAALGTAGAAPAARETAAPAACTAPPTPGSTPDTHAKVSSLAPSGHGHKRAYGAPIPKPIVSKHAKPRHKAVSPPSTASSK